MQTIQTVTRRYSIKKILAEMPEWLRIKTEEELKEAWGATEGQYFNRLINSIHGKKGPRLGEDRLLDAVRILDVDATEICTPFEETTRRSVKI